MTGSADRLPRLLALVPWLLSHPGERVADVAARFGVSERQLRSDLDLVFMCGLPGHGPGDLITVEYTGDRVTLSNADTIARPLRLTPDEGLALIVALRTMLDRPDLAAPVTRALAKLEAAAGAAARDATRLTAVVPADTGALAVCQRALAQRRRLRLRYYTPARDETTERDVDPIQLARVEGFDYLQGYCRRAEDLRVFRLDRVLGADLLDVPAEVPADTEPRDLTDGLYRAGPDDPAVGLALEPTARWVAEYYPCEQVSERPGGGLSVRLRSADPGVVVRLVCRLGGAATVLDPPEVAAEVRRRAQEALAGYR